MADFFKNTFGKIAEYFKNLEKGQKTRLIVFTFLAVAIIIAASVLLNQQSYTVLYSGMEAQDAGEVLALLDEMNVDAKPQGTDTILVESSQADSVRMQLAAEGYPKSGLNFDIFSNASGLGATDMEKRVYYQFQLQENLGQVIKKMEKIDDAVVSLSLAQESAFVLSEDEKPASASVLLKLKEGATLEPSEARTIAELVSKSVSGLSLDDVRIVDANMKLYSLEEEEMPTPTAQETYEVIGTQLALQKSVQDSIREQVINLLTPVFGEERVFAEVSVTLNFDRQKSESVEFAPPLENGTEGLAVSMQELAESIKGDAAASGVAGLDSSGGTSTTTVYPELETDEDSIYSKVSRETNLELNETRTQIDNAQGQVLDLSVGVVINSTDMEDDYSENVQKLVANAIGVEPDKVSVEMMPFFQLDTNEPGIEEAFNSQKEMMSQAARASTTRTLIIAGTIVLVFLIALLAAATLRKKPAPVLYAVNGEPGAMVDLEAGDEDILPTIGEPEPAEVPDIPEIENTTLSSLEKYIDKSPDAVVQLLRNWLSDDVK
ncbi:MAG TPA: flagellar basal-body MS-ring/collar protein FliF [Feifaniaceae bacterium]|nr:flagellar basal-body MS-ring/collar protein FliF [Feifaniaceae bacterium]